MRKAFYSLLKRHQLICHSQKSWTLLWPSILILTRYCVRALIVSRKKLHDQLCYVLGNRVDSAVVYYASPALMPRFHSTMMPMLTAAQEVQSSSLIISKGQMFTDCTNESTRRAFLKGPLNTRIKITIWFLRGCFQAFLWSQPACFWDYLNRSRVRPHLWAW